MIGMSPEPEPADHDAKPLLYAFLNTEYRIMTEPVTTVRIGRCFAQLDDYAGNGGWAIVTAFNPRGVLRTALQNQTAAAALDLRIQQMQTGRRAKTIHRAVETETDTRWPYEHGRLFGFSTANDVHQLAHDFEQAAVVTGHIRQPATLWLYGDAWPDPLPAHVRKMLI